MVDAYFGRFVLPEDLHAALMKCRSIAYIETQEELDELVFGPTHSSRYDVVYNIVGKGSVTYVTNYTFLKILSSAMIIKNLACENILHESVYCEISS